MAIMLVLRVGAGLKSSVAVTVAHRKNVMCSEVTGKCSTTVGCVQWSDL